MTNYLCSSIHTLQWVIAANSSLLTIRQHNGVDVGVKELQFPRHGSRYLKEQTTLTGEDAWGLPDKPF